MEIRAILFDKDGTLIDFHATWAGFARQAALEAAGRDPDRALHLLEALGLDAATGRFRPGSVLAAGSGADVAAVLWPDAEGQALQDRIGTLDDLAATHARDHAVALAGIPQALRSLQASGRALGIATNDSERGARETMVRLELDALFTAILGYDSVPRAKPWPDMIHAFAGHAAVAPGAVAMVGDNLHDLEAARRAGAGLAIGVLSGTSGHGDLASLADVVLDSVADLPAWLATLQKA
ncbi:MAG: HAD family hydrolase [Zhengella sp.]|uniref:HAD family hydrolase n=1 Tax=Zhengella sp. TaxID=2282762 RepID=UPI001D809928|nr:HAD family hydrolase [Notoacmeibacter sp.]MCC0025450.1 HAD family hydrolase [Brucellaceae bacterium]